MVTYDSAEIYISSAKTNKAKIAAIDLIIDALMLTAVKSAGKAHISEYQLNDGQTTIKTVYSGTSAVKKAIEDFEALKQLYVNRLNGRIMRMVDSKNINGNRF